MAVPRPDRTRRLRKVPREKSRAPVKTAFSQHQEYERLKTIYQEEKPIKARICQTGPVMRVFACEDAPKDSLVGIYDFHNTEPLTYEHIVYETIFESSKGLVISYLRVDNDLQNVNYCSSAKGSLCLAAGLLSTNVKAGQELFLYLPHIEYLALEVEDEQERLLCNAGFVIIRESFHHINAGAAGFGLCYIVDYDGTENVWIRWLWSGKDIQEHLPTLSSATTGLSEGEYLATREISSVTINSIAQPVAMTVEYADIEESLGNLFHGVKLSVAEIDPSKLDEQIPEKVEYFRNVLRDRRDDSKKRTRRRGEVRRRLFPPGPRSVGSGQSHETRVGPQSQKPQSSRYPKRRRQR